MLNCAEAFVVLLGDVLSVPTPDDNVAVDPILAFQESRSIFPKFKLSLLSPIFPSYPVKYRNTVLPIGIELAKSCSLMVVFNPFKLRLVAVDVIGNGFPVAESVK